MNQRKSWSLPVIFVICVLVASGMACGRGSDLEPSPESVPAIPTQPPAQAPAGQVPTEQPAAEQPTSQQPAVEEPTAEQPAAEQPPAQQPPAQEPPVSGLPVIDYFYAESSSNAGCFFLFWDLHDAKAAYLNGQGVTAPNSTEVCPQGSASYTLMAMNDAGSVEETVTVEKGEPPQPPPAPVPSGNPDLVITDAHFDLDPALQGQPFTAILAVENRGDAGAGPFTVFWQFHAATGLKNCCSTDFQGLGPGERLEWSFAGLVTNAEPGTSPSWVEVDYGDRVAEGESGEGNNRVNLTLSVVLPPPPPPGPASVPASPTNLRLASGVIPVGKIALEWDHDSVSVDLFRVRLVGVGWAAETGPGETSVLLDAPACGVTFRFRVQACNSVGCSDPSNTLSVEGSCQ